jgi:hypothetical protein
MPPIGVRAYERMTIGSDSLKVGMGAAFAEGWFERYVVMRLGPRQSGAGRPRLGARRGKAEESLVAVTNPRHLSTPHGHAFYYTSWENKFFRRGNGGVTEIPRGIVERNTRRPAAGLRPVRPRVARSEPCVHRPGLSHQRGVRRKVVFGGGSGSRLALARSTPIPTPPQAICAWRKSPYPSPIKGEGRKGVSYAAPGENSPLLCT